MKRGMTIEELLTEVQRQTSVKQDFLSSTKESVRMIHIHDSDPEIERFKDRVALALLKDGGGELQRFSISDNCHKQIAMKLDIPRKYYFRLLRDHRDMVIDSVNKLFEREPANRMLRTLDGVARAFLSDRYKRIDNDEVLSQVLPPLVKAAEDGTPPPPNQLLSSNVGDDRMHLKILFTDDKLSQTISEGPRGSRTVKPGVSFSNSETGNGTLQIRGFFYQDYCLNGCVFGRTDMFSFRRPHLGGKLVADDEHRILFSDRTAQLQDQTMMAEMNDVVQRLASPEFAQEMGDRLRALSESTTVQNPRAAVDVTAKIVNLSEKEKDCVLESLIRDQDYSRWGMLNAITEIANRKDVSYDRACEIEEAGWNIAELTQVQWRSIVEAEPIAA